MATPRHEHLARTGDFAEDDNEQLRIYESQFPVFWQADYVHGITFGGWIYRDSGRNGWLVRGSIVRPAMTWLMQHLGRNRL